MPVASLNSGSTAWLLISAALVLLMTPGLAFFYGGMLKGKSVTNMLMMSLACMAVVTVVWVLYGYSLAFTHDIKSGFLGGFDGVGLLHITKDSLVGPDSDRVPEYAFVAFQLMFAILTPALISGALADRARFFTWTVFVAIWVTVVYIPIAHWVFYTGEDGQHAGWLNALGAIDFAGGTVVHINAGAAALAVALVVGKRPGWKGQRMAPANLPLVLLGAGLLWFGWFGFNAGSALASNGLAATAFLNTQVATAAAVLGWVVVEYFRDGESTPLGAASGAVSGLVAITPACASVDPLGALIIGLVAGALCAWGVSLKYRLGYDDSLDVVGVHLVGGLVGSMAIGLFATDTVTEGIKGLFYGGNADQLGKQAIAVVAVGGYSFVATLIIAFLLDRTIGFRLSRKEAIRFQESADADTPTESKTTGSHGRAGTTVTREGEDTDSLELRGHGF